MDVSLAIIIPGSGSILFSAESLVFPGVREALALGSEAVRTRMGLGPDGERFGGRTGSGLNGSHRSRL